MHTSFHIGDTEIMASDGHCKNHPEFKGFSLSILADSPDQVTQHFNALSDGGSIQVPLCKTFFSERYGMLTDKFGVTWMLLVQQ